MVVVFVFVLALLTAGIYFTWAGPQALGTTLTGGGVLSSILLSAWRFRWYRT